MSPAQGLDFASVFVFALTGALVASRAQLDIIGFLFVASLTAVGGGTIRDVILRRDQVFWVAEPIYIGVACAAAILVFFTAHLLESRWRAILWLDAVALSIAVTAGFAVARNLDASWPVLLMMGDDHRLSRRPDARRRLQRGAAGSASGRALRHRGARRGGGGRRDADADRHANHRLSRLHRHDLRAPGRKHGVRLEACPSTKAARQGPEQGENDDQSRIRGPRPHGRTDGAQHGPQGLRPRGLRREPGRDGALSPSSTIAARPPTPTTPPATPRSPSPSCPDRRSSNPS